MVTSGDGYCLGHEHVPAARRRAARAGHERLLDGPRHRGLRDLLAGRHRLECHRRRARLLRQVHGRRELRLRHGLLRLRARALPAPPRPRAHPSRRRCRQPSVSACVLLILPPARSLVQEADTDYTSGSEAYDNGAGVTAIAYAMDQSRCCEVCAATAGCAASVWITPPPGPPKPHPPPPSPPSTECSFTKDIDFHPVSIHAAIVFATRACAPPADYAALFGNRRRS